MRVAARSQLWRLELKTGRFKVPFGREELIGGTNLDFVRRSLIAKYLAPGRDTGVQGSLDGGDF